MGKKEKPERNTVKAHGMQKLILKPRKWGLVSSLGALKEGFWYAFHVHTKDI